MESTAKGVLREIFARPSLYGRIGILVTGKVIFRVSLHEAISSAGRRVRSESILRTGTNRGGHAIAHTPRYRCAVPARDSDAISSKIRSGKVLSASSTPLPTTTNPRSTSRLGFVVVRSMRTLKPRKEFLNGNSRATGKPLHRSRCHP